MQKWAERDGGGRKKDEMEAETSPKSCRKPAAAKLRIAENGTVPSLPFPLSLVRAPFVSYGIGS